MSRLLNAKEDKRLRKSEQKIIQNMPEYFPIELESETGANPNDPQIDSSAQPDHSMYTSTQLLIIKQLKESKG